MAVACLVLSVPAAAPPYGEDLTILTKIFNEQQG